MASVSMLLPIFIMELVTWAALNDQTCKGVMTDATPWNTGGIGLYRATDTVHCTVQYLIVPKYTVLYETHSTAPSLHRFWCLCCALVRHERD